MSSAAHFEPAGEGHFLLRVELDAFGALDVQIAEERFVPAGEGEPGHRSGHADVDADHAGVEVPLELPGGVAGAGEDAGAVAVFAVAAHGEGIVEVLRAHDGEDRAEDFFLRQPHAGLHLIDDAGAEQEAVFGKIRLRPSRATLAPSLAATSRYEATFSRCCAEMTGPMSTAPPESVGPTFIALPTFTRPSTSGIGNAADGHGQTAGHAAFAGTAEGRSLNGFDSLIEIGVGHDDEVVFRAAGGLHALAVARAGFVNVLGDVGRADEGDRPHERMREQGVDTFFIAVDDVEHAVGEAGFHKQLAQAHGRQRNFFGRLQARTCCRR